MNDHPEEDVEVLKELSTTFKYMKGECGHSHDSKLKPRLIYFKKHFTFLSSYSIPIIAALLEECLKSRREDEVVILCSEIYQVKTVEAALRKIKRTLVTYTPYLKGEYPEDINILKNDAISNLEAVNTILISDYRSIRGLEVTHTIIFVDPQLETSANSLIEAVTRTISNIDIISIKPLSDNPSTSIEKAFQKYSDKQLTIVTQIETLVAADQTDIVEVQFTDDASRQSKTIKKQITDSDRNNADSIKELNANEELWQNILRYELEL